MHASASLLFHTNADTRWFVLGGLEGPLSPFSEGVEVIGSATYHFEEFANQYRDRLALVTPTLLAMLDSPDTNEVARVLAFLMFTRVDPQRVVPELTSIVTNANKSLPIRTKAVKAPGCYGPDAETARPLIQDLTGSEVAAMAEEAGLALRRLSGEIIKNQSPYNGRSSFPETNSPTTE